MAEVRDARADLLDRAHDTTRERGRADDQVRDLVKAVQKDRSRAVELARVDLRSLESGTQQLVGRLLAEQLRGQLPPALTQSLVAGQVTVDLMERLAQRLANSQSQEPQNRFGRAQSPEMARELASDRSVPQQALRWTQFVQKTQHIPRAEVQQRSGVASPKGEGTALAEILSGKGGVLGPGLRAPRLVERGMGDLSPAQRQLLMRATFGETLARELTRLGIGDPLAFVRAGSLPETRAELALALNMPRARLLGLLMQAELLRLGPGKNGELALHPELLGALRHAGIAMLGTLAALRGMTRQDLTSLYNLMRAAKGDLTRVKRGGRPPVKRDLAHWARAAARKPSEILLPDVARQNLSRAEAQELVQAWYTENLLWDTLAQARRRQEELAQGRDRARRERGDEQQRGQDQRQDGDPAWADDPFLELTPDEGRGDHLMCFWVTDYNTNPLLPGGVRRMYVCIDPETGAILPQAIEAELQT